MRITQLTNEDLALIIAGELKVYQSGVRHYFNGAGWLHRIGGPAIINPCGFQGWYQHGKRHRENGPAVIWEGVGKEFWLNGKQVKPF